MRYPGSSTVTFHPVSPIAPPFGGTIDATGNILLMGETAYVWDESLGAYRYQEPGHPPGAVHMITPMPDDYYVVSQASPPLMMNIPVQVGTTTVGT